MHANKQLVYRENWSLNKSVTKLLFINSIIIIFKHKMKSKQDTSQHYKTNLLLCILFLCGFFRNTKGISKHLFIFPSEVLSDLYHLNVVPSFAQFI